jgi:hypothetical protein
MIELTAAQVAAATGGTLHGDPDARVTGPVVTDSRKAEPGALFVAWEGEAADGHAFVPSAVAAGAVVVLAARELPGAGVPVVVTPDPQRALGDLARHVLARVREANPELRVVAVTGSVGKTTVKDLTAARVGAGRRVAGRPRTATRWPQAERRVWYLLDKLSLFYNSLNLVGILPRVLPTCRQGKPLPFHRKICCDRRRRHKPPQDQSLKQLLPSISTLDCQLWVLGLDPENLHLHYS